MHAHIVMDDQTKYVVCIVNRPGYELTPKSWTP